MSSKLDRVEGKAEVKNGISRLIFTAIAFALQILLILLIVLRLNAYAAWIHMATGLLAIVAVLLLYSDNRTSMMKMPWIILIMGLPILGITLFLMIGLNGFTRKARARFEQTDQILVPLIPENEDVLERFREQDRQKANISEYLKNYAFSPVYQNTDVTYFDDAVKGLDAQKEDLQQAKSFIFMEYHAIEEKETWRGIQSILEEKVKEGVEVRIIYDEMGSIGYINRDFIRRMEALGIHCRVFNPCMPVLNFFLNNRDHRKITVIDGQIGYTGGYNLADEYFHIVSPFGFWKDTGIRLQGDAVRSLTLEFLEMWNSVRSKTGNDTEFDQYLPEITYEAKEQGFVQPYADRPMDEEQVGEGVYISLAETAQRYVWYVTPYLILTDEMTHALCLAAKRGVDVRIITPGIPDKKIVYQATRSYYHALAKGGVRIYEYVPGFCHCKMCVSDDNIAVCGTINLDYRSLYHHFENSCLYYGNQAVKDMKKDFDEMLSVSRNITVRYRSGRSAALRLGQLVLRLFAPLL